MSRIFEDQDAKAMILVVALLVGVPLLAGLATPKHSATPSSLETAALDHGR